MTGKASASGASVNGLRTLELGSALLWLREELQTRLGPGEHSISMTGARTRREQEILGMSQILLVMFPFAIELALKSLWDCFHQAGTYDHRHDLDVLFQTIDRDAADVGAARLAQEQARDLWQEFQSEGKIDYQGTLDEFLATHARDFVETRYYELKPAEFVQLNDFAVCFFCVVFLLAGRDPASFSNLLGRTVPGGRPKS